MLQVWSSFTGKEDMTWVPTAREELEVQVSLEEMAVGNKFQKQSY